MIFRVKLFNDLNNFLLSRNFRFVDPQGHSCPSVLLKLALPFHCYLKKSFLMHVGTIDVLNGQIQMKMSFSLESSVLQTSATEAHYFFAFILMPLFTGKGQTQMRYFTCKAWIVFICFSTSPFRANMRYPAIKVNMKCVWSMFLREEQKKAFGATF